MVKGSTKRICKYGHDTLVVGKDAYSQCRACSRRKTLERKRKDPEHIRELNRQWCWLQAGITNVDGSPFRLTDRDKAFKVQEGRCAIRTCNKHQSELPRAMDVDHDHSTKVFRGLLCDNCNRNVVSKLTIEDAEAVVDYLKQTSVR